MIKNVWHSTNQQEIYNTTHVQMSKLRAVEHAHQWRPEAGYYRVAPPLPTASRSCATDARMCEQSTIYLMSWFNDSHIRCSNSWLWTVA